MEHRYIRKNLPSGDPFPVAMGDCIAKMDQNESPRELPDSLKQLLTNALLTAQWTRYPQPDEYMRIKKKFADTLGVSSECLAITNGCDGAIQGIHFLAGGSGRHALCFAPTYPMLHHAAWLSGTETIVKNVGPEYRIDPEKITDTDLILIANPNNPTGQLTDDVVIQAALDSRAMVFIDEAYFDFSKKSWLNQLPLYPNLAIGRSCSKSMLAGIRLGALMAHPHLINTYESLVTAPYHLSKLQLIVAENYDKILPVVETAVKEILSERQRMLLTMTAMGIKTYPTETNFILFEALSPDKTFGNLINNGIRIRNMSKILGLDRHLRVTVSKPNENDLFLNALNDS